MFNFFSGILLVLLIKFVRMLLQFLQCFMHAIANFDVIVNITLMFKFKIGLNSSWDLPEQKVVLLTVPLKIDTKKSNLPVRFQSAPTKNIFHGALRKGS